MTRFKWADFYDIYLTDLDKKVQGVVPLGRLMGSKRDINLNSIINKELRLIKVTKLVKKVPLK